MSSKKTASIFSTQTFISFLIYIFMAFLFQIIIFRSFGMLFNSFLAIFPEGVLNVGTQA